MFIWNPVILVDLLELKVKLGLKLSTSTLPETNKFAPENEWLEDDRFLLEWPIFRAMLVLGRVQSSIYNVLNVLKTLENW